MCIQRGRRQSRWSFRFAKCRDVGAAEHVRVGGTEKLAGLQRGGEGGVGREAQNQRRVGPQHAKHRRLLLGG